MRQRLLSFLLPLLSVCAGAMVPATADVILLAQAGVEQTSLAMLHSWFLSLGICSMALAMAGVVLGLACLVACWREDPAHRAAALVDWINVNGKHPGTVAWFYSASISLALFLLAGAALGRYCFTAFKTAGKRSP